MIHLTAMLDKIINSRITSGVLNTGLFGGLTANISGHILRASSHNRYGYTEVIVGYLVLAVSYFGICTRSYIRNGGIDKRYVSWLIIILVSPPFFIVNQKAENDWVSATIVVTLLALSFYGTIGEYRYQRLAMLTSQ